MNQNRVEVSKTRMTYLGAGAICATSRRKWSTKKPRRSACCASWSAPSASATAPTCARPPTHSREYPIPNFLILSLWGEQVHKCLYGPWRTGVGASRRAWTVCARAPACPGSWSAARPWCPCAPRSWSAATPWPQSPACRPFASAARPPPPP